MGQTRAVDKDAIITRSVSTKAFANLALVKYFGKRDLGLNLPAAGSLSLTLEPLITTTTISFKKTLAKDEVYLDGAPADERFALRISRFLDIVREMSGTTVNAEVQTSNAFPTAAGLASSASGFAALALAATRALGLTMSDRALSCLARRGSGSASRSIPGGIVVWREGNESDGSDSYATSLIQEGDWDLRVVVGVCDPGPKAMGSTEAMELTRLSSPYYAPWIESVNRDLKEAVTAVNKRDLEKLGEITERSALSMHAAAMAARPGIVFFKGPTVDALHLVRDLRKKGLLAYFTCDAGPQPKILCSRAHQDAIAEALGELPGISRVIPCRLGEGASVIETP